MAKRKLKTHKARVLRINFGGRKLVEVDGDSLCGACDANGNAKVTHKWSEVDCKLCLYILLEATSSTPEDLVNRCPYCCMPRHPGQACEFRIPL